MSDERQCLHWSVASMSEACATMWTETAGSVADDNSNTPRGEVVESGVQPYAGEVDAGLNPAPAVSLSWSTADDVAFAAFCSSLTVQQNRSQP